MHRRAVWDGSEIPCTTSTEQWAAGLGVLALSYFDISDPCTQELGPVADRARHAELHDRAVQAGDDARRTDRRDAVRDLDHAATPSGSCRSPTSPPTAPRRR